MFNSLYFPQPEGVLDVHLYVLDISSTLITTVVLNFKLFSCRVKKIDPSLKFNIIGKNFKFDFTGTLIPSTSNYEPRTKD